MTFAIGRPRPQRLYHDFETKSRADLTKVGSSRYSRDASTQVQMLGWAFDEGEVEQWVEDDGDLPNEVLDAIQDDRIMKNAWNAAFEKNIWANTLGVPIQHKDWTCTMTVAMSLALPGKLEDCGKVVRLADEFLKVDGKRFITKFSKPRKPSKHKPWEWASSETDPFDWLEYCHYNRQDVRAERAIWKLVKKYDFTGTERELYELDQEINAEGIPININAVQRAIRIRNITKANLFRRMIELTGIANPNSPAQLLPWLQDHGYVFDDLKKGHIERGLERAKNELDEMGDNYRAMHPEEAEKLEALIEVLDLRAQTSKTSVTKFDALLRATDTDGNLRNTFQFAGAGRTNRWAGRIFQPQNLAKPVKELEKAVPMIVEHIETLEPDEFAMLYPRPIDALSAAIRPMVQAGEEDGEEMEFADADLSAIENIVLGWCSQEPKILSVFQEGRDPYLDFGRYMYGRSYEDLKAEFEAGNKDARTTCKPGVLGCGYGLGKGAIFENEKTGELEASGLLGYAWNMKVKTFTLEQSERSVSVWRETFTKAVDFWGDINGAALRAVKTGIPQTAGPVEFRMEGPFLRMYLPSSRALSYLRPKIEMKPTPWGEKKQTLTYEGKDTKTGKWHREKTYGGKLTENACQAIARDVLGHGMLLARAEGLKIRLHVHDEILTRGFASRREEDLRVLKECMMAPPPWATDLPLNVGGFTSPIFVKD